MTRPTRLASKVYDANNHTADTQCWQKWFWCRIHWWPRFDGATGQQVFADQARTYVATGEKWYEPYPLTVNRKVNDVWVSVVVHCGPGTFYPKPANNRSYAK